MVVEELWTPSSLIPYTLGSLTTIAGVGTYVRYFRRFPSSEWVHPRYLAKRRWIKGVVTSVGDADNFRLYHTPGPFWRWPLKFRSIPSRSKDLRDQTIHIRMAGVDAPEAAHFGKPKQPYSEEALAWLKSQVEGKRVWVQLLRRDQYGRIVAIPQQLPRFLPPFLGGIIGGKCISLEMLRAGWAVVYEQSGAEFGTWGKDEFLKMEAEAKKARRGMWVNGVAVETPSEYKKRYAAGNASIDDVESQSVPQPETEKKSFWRRLFSSKR